MRHQVSSNEDTGTSPVLPWKLEEARWLEHQLGMVSSGERIHHSTRDALRRRGYIRPSGRGLTEWGRKTLVEVRQHLSA